MKIFLIRHAIAEDRLTWAGDDTLRPLTGEGRGQAARLAAALAGESVRRVISSPSLRCLETVAQVAVGQHRGIEFDDHLGESGDPDALIAWVGELEGPTVVLCSHREPIATAITALARAGVPCDGDLRFKKAATWSLEVDRQRVRRLAYLPPP